MSLHAGTLVGRYRVSRLIAQGGMAEVYRAEQELAGGIYRPAALKVIRPEYSESPDFREMFLDEARLACTLAHPNIVHIYEVGESDGRLYMAMELVSGESLASVARTLREKSDRFSNEALIAIGIYTCSALEAVHGLRIPDQGHVNLVHRDVSPHNLLLSANGSIKLIDFGIAKATSNRNLTSAGVTKGKAGYFSPEQAMGKALDGRSDLFSLGVTLYKLAWGATPFDQHKGHHERNTALVHGEWEPLRKVCPGLPEGFYDVVDRALQVHPDDRFPDAAQMRLALERLALESSFTVGPSTLAGYVRALEEDEKSLAEARVDRSGRHARQALTSNPGSNGATVPTRVSPTHATEALSAGVTVGRGGRTSQPPVSKTAQISRVAAAPQPSAAPSATSGPRRTERMLARAVTLPSVESLRLRGWKLPVSVAAGVLLFGTVVFWVASSSEAEEGLIAAPADVPPAIAVQVEVPPEATGGPAGPASAIAEAREQAETLKGDDTLPASASALEPSAPATPSVTRLERRSTARPTVRREPAQADRSLRNARTADDRVRPRSTSGLPGRLRFGPGDGVVTINGRVRGNSPMDVVLAPGIYSVVVKSPDGSNSLTRTVEVRGDDINAIVVNFDRP